MKWEASNRIRRMAARRVRISPLMTTSTEGDRLRLLAKIEALRPGSRALSLVTGDRRGLETKIAGDVIPLVYDHLRSFGHVEEVDLFLYTAGGDTLAGFGLVNLIREYCTRFVVIAPFRCLSTGTLIALGADEVFLAPGAQLGPIDPSVSSPFNPPAPGLQQPGRVSLVPVSVEDLIGFMHFVRNEAAVKDETATAEILKVLAEKVHPLALGAVYRAREQVNQLAKSLLKGHIDSDARVDTIVETLTKLPSHSYIISRREAEAILGSDFVSAMPEDLEQTTSEFYRAYEEWLDLTNPYSADAVIGESESRTETFPRAVLESRRGSGLMTHTFRTVKELTRVQVTQPGLAVPVAGVQERIIAEGWIRGSEGEDNQ